MFDATLIGLGLAIIGGVAFGVLLWWLEGNTGE